MKRKILRYGLFFIVLLFLDQFVKEYIIDHFTLGESFSIIPHFFSLTYVRNYGAVFGFLNDSSTKWQFWLFMGALFLVFYFVYSTLRKDKENTVLWLASSLLLAGGIGNTIDRIQYRYVIDFIDFFIGSYHWPAFNFADIYIIIAIIILLFEPYLTKIIKNKVK